MMRSAVFNIAHFLPKSAGFSPHNSVSHFKTTSSRSSFSASQFSALWMMAKRGPLRGVCLSCVLHSPVYTHEIALRESEYTGTCFPCFSSHVRAWTIARNSPTLFVPSGNGPTRKISFCESVWTPRYSSLPGDPLQAASTQMEGRIGLTLASFHFPCEAGFPLNAAYSDW